MNKLEEISIPYSYLNKAKDDEPMFILLARDPVAAQAIRFWANQSSRTGMHDAEKIADAFIQADNFDMYRGRILSNLNGATLPESLHDPLPATTEPEFLLKKVCGVKRVDGQVCVSGPHTGKHFFQPVSEKPFDTGEENPIE